MSKTLLINASLKHACDFVEPFLHRLEVYLDKQGEDVVDVRDYDTFDERTFFEYDHVVFVFMTSLNMLPSSMLEILNKLEGQTKQTKVYSLIVCDEYETEKCDLSQKILEKWCEKENCLYQGTLKIGSGLFIMKTTVRFIVSNHIQSLAKAIKNDEDYLSQVTVPTMSHFMRNANRYWTNEIKKKQKEILKRKKAITSK